MESGMCVAMPRIPIARQYGWLQLRKARRRHSWCLWARSCFFSSHARVFCFPPCEIRGAAYGICQRQVRAPPGCALREGTCIRMRKSPRLQPGRGRVRLVHRFSGRLIGIAGLSSICRRLPGPLDRRHIGDDSAQCNIFIYTANSHGRGGLGARNLKTGEWTQAEIGSNREHADIHCGG